MTEAAQQQAKPPQPRGAGSGESANASRSRNIIDWPPEPKSHEDHVAELLQQAQDNEDYNNEINAIQTEQLAKLKETLGFPQGDPADADEQRKEAKEAYLASVDPKKKEAALKGEMKARAEREKAALAK